MRFQLNLNKIENRRCRLNKLAFLCLGSACLTISAFAQSIEPIYSFTNSSFTSPRNPRADLILGRDGNFYGTTDLGGSGGFGTVFQVTTGGVLSVLANFDGSSNGGTPSGGVTLGPDGNLYGTTFFAGPGSGGTVFRLTTSGVLTNLYSFSPSTSNLLYYPQGSYPKAGLLPGPAGYFYGTTSQGGANSAGTVFRITTNGVLTTLFSFSALSGSPSTNTTGASPYARLTLGPDGNLYGTTFLGGAKGDGTVFKVTPNGEFTRLVDFGGTNGVGPRGTLIVGPDNLLYGTTVNGGIYGDEGTVFSITTNGLLTTLVSFNYNTGGAPEAGVTLGPDGNLYGTDSVGSSASTGAGGTVFRVTTGGLLTTLASFANTNGSTPEGGVVFGPDGNLYGTTSAGGSADPNAAGEIYRLNLGLRVTNTPTSISLSIVSGAVTLALTSAPGSTNRLWATTNVSLPMTQWQVLATNVAVTGVSQFTDTNTTAYQVKFYRLSTP